MKKLLMLLTVVCFIFSAPSLFAGTEAGDTELGLQGSIQNISPDEGDEDITMLILAGSLGYFFTDALSVGVSVMGNLMSYDDYDSTQMSFLIEPNYHFNTESDIVPYVGVNGGITKFESEDTSESMFSYGAQIGFKSFFAENASFKVEGRYTHFEMDDEDVGVDILGLFVGVNVYF